MVMVIKSNVTSSALSQADGWDPAFNTDGLIYANIFGRGDLTANYAAGGARGVVGGTPTIIGEYAELGPQNYINTGIRTGSTQTFIAIAVDDPTTANAVNRRFLISSQGPSGFAGKTLLIHSNSSHIYMYSDYVYDDKGGQKNNYFSQVLLRDNTAAPSFMYGRDYGTGIDVGDAVSVKALEVDGSPNTTADYTFHIGTNAITAPNEGVIYIAAALIFNRAISDAEMGQVYSYFKDYYARRGIVI